jgi:hypothetical protein
MEGFGEGRNLSLEMPNSHLPGPRGFMGIPTHPQPENTVFFDSKYTINPIAPLTPFGIFLK